eukprot:scaffold23684_cov69-Phaeocystis_antarctica.AAC.3
MPANNGKTTVRLSGPSTPGARGLWRRHFPPADLEAAVTVLAAPGARLDALRTTPSPLDKHALPLVGRFEPPRAGRAEGEFGVAVLESHLVDPHGAVRQVECQDGLECGELRATPLNREDQLNRLATAEQARLDIEVAHSTDVARVDFVSARKLLRSVDGTERVVPGHSGQAALQSLDGARHRLARHEAGPHSEEIDVAKVPRLVVHLAVHRVAVRRQPQLLGHLACRRREDLLDVFVLGVWLRFARQAGEGVAATDGPRGLEPARRGLHGRVEADVPKHCLCQLIVVVGQMAPICPRELRQRDLEDEAEGLDFGEAATESEAPPTHGEETGALIDADIPPVGSCPHRCAGHCHGLCVCGVVRAARDVSRARRVNGVTDDGVTRRNRRRCDAA